jgi:hypothetical protein
MLALGIILECLGVISFGLTIFSDIKYSKDGNENPFSVIIFMLLTIICIPGGIMCLFEDAQNKNGERWIRCSEYRVDEETHMLNDSIIEKSYIIHYKE